MILQWISAIASLAAIIGVIVSWPKNRGEGRKLDAEAVVLKDGGDIKNLREILAESRQACADCREDLATSERRQAARDTAIDALIDVMVELLPFVPPDKAAPARAAIATARQARHNIE